MVPVPVTPPTDVAALVGHARNWLGRNGFPLPPTRVIADPASHPAGDRGGFAWAQPGEVAFEGAGADVASLASRYGKRGRLNDRQTYAAQTVLHELIHQMRYGRTPDFYRSPEEGPGWWEEAATEATARDLLPNFTRELFGHRLRNTAQFQGNDYDDRTTYLRRLSGAAALNPKGWRGIPARQYRRTFSHATPEDRELMARAAQEAIRAQKAKPRRAEA